MVSVHLAELTEDDKQARDIERRRREEAARRERIFCPRQLKMGLETETLAAQQKERKDREETEKSRDSAYDQQALYFGAVLELQRAEIEQERRDTMRLIAQYNLTAARKKELQREFATETERAFNVEESRASAGASSLLVLEGEDASLSTRRRKQQQQQKDAIQEHLFQRALQQQQEENFDMDYADFTARSCRAQEAVHQQQMKAKAQRRLETARNNLELAEQRRQREAAQKQTEKKMAEREVDMKLHDPFLAEGRQDLILGDASLGPSLPRVPTGCLGQNRDGFKGFPAEVREAAVAENRERQQHKTERDRESKQIEQQWETYAERQRRLSVALERERERQRRQLAVGVAEMNARLREEQNERETFRNRELYRGPIGTEYSKYFSTTSR